MTPKAPSIVIRVPDPFNVAGVRIELDGVDVTDCWITIRLLADGRALLDMCRRDAGGRIVPGILGPQVIGPYSIETLPAPIRKAGWPPRPAEGG